jgi:phenylalanyl-tRNA synthetase beta chain
MLISLNWLKEFTPYSGSVQELADRLTMTGLEVEEIIRPYAHLKDVVVGRVLSCEPHPDADKLTLCTVEAGQGRPLPIVCGAPNVAAGQTVAVALPGAVLPGELEIKKAKIRGVESIGMILAEDEAGLGEDHSGIMVLDDSLEIGTPLSDTPGLDDVVLDIGVTPNRADCLSILGLARETAMIFGLPLSLPPVDPEESGAGNAAEMVEIRIDRPELCPAYRARIVSGLAVGPSPDWMQRRLRAVGMRPINNIVDVTNYVMFEFGQPLHAFDKNLLAGGMIRVDTAQDGMKFTTLDDQERSLLKSDLLIWDGEKPVALAGVMGGANTEMREDSSEVLIESAVFDPAAVRKTARRLALPSESSYRFERGVDQPGSAVALDRAARLMARVSGGRVVPGVAEAEPRPLKPVPVRFRRPKAEALLGVELESKFCEDVLYGMGCSLLEGDPEDMRLQIPSHRLDLEREEDLIEEVARVYGMDRIPAVLPHVAKSLESIREADTTYNFAQKLKDWGRGAGLLEAVNYSFVGQEDLDLLGLPEDERVPVKNPLSEDQNVLRTRLAPGLLNNLRHNLAQGQGRLRLFEVSCVFLAEPDSPTTAREPRRLGMLLYGALRPQRWPYAQGEADYEEIKGLSEHLVAHLGLPKPEFKGCNGVPYLDLAVEVLLEGERLGVIGTVKPDIADAYHARRTVWLAELDADLLKRKYEGGIPAFSALPKFPPVRRDVTVISPEDLTVERVQEVIAEAREKLLEDSTLVAVFNPQAGKRNLTFRLTYRHPERTLKDKEVDKRHQKIVDRIVKELPVSV